jgi:hypothetical protein
MWFWEGYSPKVPVAWTKIPRTDPKFCYGPNDPSDHYCNRPNEGGSAYSAPYSERFRLDPIHGQPINDMNLRKKVQWQWYPVVLNNAGIDFFGQSGDPLVSLDVDYDGHEETILRYFMKDPVSGCVATFNNFNLDGSQYDPGEEYLPTFSNANCKSTYQSNGGGWIGQGAWVVDGEAGDLAMSHNMVDELSNIPKPGFNQGKAKIFTTTSGSLNIDQENQGSQSQNISHQEKDTRNVIEREIQLSNNTGRFDRSSVGAPWNASCINGGSGFPTCYKFDGDLTGAPSLTSNENDAVEVSCAGCCHDAGHALQTCFDTNTNILYVRSITASKIGHKYKTLTPIQNVP